MRYRAEIDGLRAVAVVPVILFHAGLSGLSGGFVGVDVFFVISGYLITSLIHPDIESGAFSLVRFYERRARRILPALFFVCLLCVPFAWHWLLPQDFKEFGESLAAVAVFASNIYFCLKSDYFAAPAATIPLLHTWSLAVEEQFYLLFPLLLLASRRMSRRTLIVAISTGSLASLGIAELSSRPFPSADFYLVHTRAWELGVGALLALSDGRWTIRHRALRELAALTGLILIVYSVFAFDESRPHPGLITLLPVMGAAVLIATATPETIVGRMLSSRPFVGIGLISYSAYLWHQPLFAFARYPSLTELSVPMSLLLSLAAMVLAYFSWRFVEQPFRRGGLASREQVFRLAASGSVLFIVIGIFTSATGGFGSRFDAVAARFPEYALDNRKLRAQSWQPLRSVTNDKKYSIESNAADGRLWFSSSQATTKILIVGNSHAKDLYNVFVLSRQLFPGHEFARYGTQISCLANDGHNEFFQSPNYRSADVVLISTRWSEAPNCGGPDNDFDALEHLAQIARKDGKLLVVASDTLEFPRRGHYTLSDAAVVAATRAGSTVGEQALAASINRRLFETRGYSGRNARVNARLRAMAEKFDLVYLDKEDYLCDQSRSMCWGMTPNFKKTLYDGAHYTLDGAREFGPRVQAAGWLSRIDHALQNGPHRGRSRADDARTQGATVRGSSDDS